MGIERSVWHYLELLESIPNDAQIKKDTMVFCLLFMCFLQKFLLGNSEEEVVTYKLQDTGAIIELSHSSHFAEVRK